MKRLHAKAPRLSRLTLLAGLNKWPEDARIAYALAHIEAMEKAEPATVIAMYREAAKKGAAKAWIDLARFHLAHLQFKDAVVALREANQAGLFAADIPTKELVDEVTR
jgi:hypothetical protein